MGTSSLSGLCHCKLNINSSHNMKTLSFGILLTLCVFAKGQDKQPEINCDAVGMVLGVLKDAVDGRAHWPYDPMPTGPTPKAEDDGMKDEDMTDEDLVKAGKAILGNTTFEVANQIFKDNGKVQGNDCLWHCVLVDIVTGKMNMTKMAIAIGDSGLRADGSSRVMTTIEDLKKFLMENCPELMSDDDEGSDMDSDGGFGGSDGGFGGSDGGFGGSDGGFRGSDGGFGGGSDGGFGGSDGGFGGGSDGEKNQPDLHPQSPVLAVGGLL